MKILKTIIPVLAIVAVIGLSAAGYFYNQYQKAQKEIQTIKTDPHTVQKSALEEVKKLVMDVTKLIELPIGEDPTVATVTDVGKLKDQIFFQKAKNGDKVLIYTKAKKAILYDPIAKKIIDVAPVNIGSSSAQTTARIVLRNGTTTIGLTNKVEAEIKKAVPDANITSKENASNQNFEKSIFVILSSGAKDSGESLAKSLNIPVGNLPQGEAKPSADILIILGKDKI